MWFFYALIATVAFALVNVVDSMIVEHMEAHPLRNQWCQSFGGVLMLSAAAPFLSLNITWMTPLLIAGAVGVLADLLFLYTIHHIDVSLVNIAWALQALIITAMALVFFHEHWTSYESIGAVIILGTIVVLSLSHAQFSWRAVALLGGIALLNAQYYLLQKYVLLQGADIVSAAYWGLAGREVCSFLIPWLIPSFRGQLAPLRDKKLPFFVMMAAAASLFFFAITMATFSYQAGPASLVSVVSNVQPFFVIGLAWVFSILTPRFAPKEELSRASVTAKIVAFISVFFGLALLAWNQ